jgi:hypothetical protein
MARTPAGSGPEHREQCVARTHRRACDEALEHVRTVNDVRRGQPRQVSDLNCARHERRTFGKKLYGRTGAKSKYSVDLAGLSGQSGIR